ncbi:MAG: LuxR C-terminal-related transcriptional regulator [Mediterraneibacter faecis]
MMLENNLPKSIYFSFQQMMRFRERGRNERAKRKESDHQKMMKEGKTYKQISEETGISYSTISIYAGQIRRKEREAHSFNGNRHLCMTCKYRASDARKGCDYILITDHERGCDPSECTKYEKGVRYREIKTKGKSK